MDQRPPQNSSKGTLALRTGISPARRGSRVDGSVDTPYRCCVAETTTIRISRETHARVMRLAAERHETVDELVSSALRALRQDSMGRDLAEELTQDETAWLDADAG